MEFKFQRNRTDKIPSQKIIEEMERVSKIFDHVEFGWRDFNKHGNISAGTIKREFGTWREALSALKKYLNGKGLDLAPRKFPYNRQYSDEQMFQEMERIWVSLGHRPSRNEWEASDPKISYNAYKNRFGGWTSTCLNFIEFKMGGVITTNEPLREKGENEKAQKGISTKTGSGRTVLLGVRLKVLSRDNFRCAFCGRSPATDIGVKLHIDHIVPFSKGGKATLDNLQTLCNECNLGKGNRHPE